MNITTNTKPMSKKRQTTIDQGRYTSNVTDINLLSNLTSHANNDSFMNYVNKDKYKNVRKFEFHLFRNETKTFVKTVHLERNLVKKIMTMELMNELFAGNALNLKMVKLNNLGIFIELVGEEVEINDLLIQYHQKQIFLCFFEIEENILIDINNNPDAKLIAIHIKNTFEDPKPYSLHEKNRSLNGLEIPYLTLFEAKTQMNSENTFRMELYKKIRGRMVSEQYMDEFRYKSKDILKLVNIKCLYTLENQDWIFIDALSKIRSNDLTSFEFINILKEKVIRLGIELNDEDKN
jgi:hypothetical protein